MELPDKFAKKTMKYTLLLLLLVAGSGCTKVIRPGHPGSGGESGNAPSPIQVFTGMYEESYLLRNDSLWVIGTNPDGQFGLGNTTNVDSWTLTMTDVQTVSPGFYQTLVLKKDGSVWAAGGNEAGELGDGTTTTSLTWKMVMTGVLSISAGYEMSFFIKSDHSLWGVADNQDWATVNGLGLHKIMDSVQSVAGGTDALLIIKMDNTLWGLGHNTDWEFGNAFTVDTETDTPIALMTNVSAVALSGYYSLVLKTDGTLWASGDDAIGQLGVPDAPLYYTMVLSNVKAIAAGYATSMAIKNDSTLWVSGDNSEGTLGDSLGGPDGPEQAAYGFKQVLTGIASGSVEGRTLLVVRGDNTVWGAGTNSDWNLGVDPVSAPYVVSFRKVVVPD